MPKLALADDDGAVLVLLGIPSPDHLRQDLCRGHVGVALELDVVELRLELGDALRLLLELHQAQVLSFILAFDVGLLPTALRPNLQKMSTNAPQS